MATNRDDLINVRQRRYLARDFDSLRAQLLEYARLYYPDKLRDFSESSVGGLFLDLAAYAGDNLSFYLDHQFGELDPTTAVEDVNIQRSLQQAGVPIVGAAPALVVVTAFVQVPAKETNNSVEPDDSAIPIVKADTIFTSDSGVDFILLEDIDFAARNTDGSNVADIRVDQRTPSGVPTSFIMAASGVCVSGAETTESVSIPSTFVPFRKLTLENPNVSEIITVYDGLGNTYYNVSALTHDVVYRNVLNGTSDNDLVRDSIKVVPAPYRFTSETDIASRRITLTFGGGNANTLEDDVIPDPSSFAISFPNVRTFSRVPVNPNQLLNTKTLGVASAGTTYTIRYRHGGGLDHNVEANTVKTVTTLKMTFPRNPSPATAGRVRNSVECINRMRASGGEDAPSADDLKELLPSVRNSQERIVTRPDLLARVYALPSNFGRVFRAAIRSNPNNPLATQLFIISRNSKSQLITSPDTLKQNLVRWLNPYRMIADAIDVLDARIVNLTLTFDVLVDPTLNKSIVLQAILKKLQKTFNIKNFNIDQPIVVDTVKDEIYRTSGVISLNNIRFNSISGIVNNRVYSDSTFDVASNTRQGIIFPPGGGIFEVRYPEIDVIAKASV
jgi:hypothetical protein